MWLNFCSTFLVQRGDSTKEQIGGVKKNPLVTLHCQAEEGLQLHSQHRALRRWTVHLGWKFQVLKTIQKTRAYCASIMVAMHLKQLYFFNWLSAYLGSFCNCVTPLQVCTEIVVYDLHKVTFSMISWSGQEKEVIINMQILFWRGNSFTSLHYWLLHEVLATNSAVRNFWSKQVKN